jgi:hypothetical protein
MEPQSARKAIVHRVKGNFVVESNIGDVQWPQQCAVCGGPVETTDRLHLHGTFKALGRIDVDVDGIPYCRECFPKVHRGKLLERVRTVLAFVLGIPLGLYLIVLSMQQQSSGSRFVWIGMIMVLALAAGFGLSWLIVDFPIRALFKGRFARPVDAWLIQEKKTDNREGMSIVISIPNKDYAAAFAGLNGA